MLKIIDLCVEINEISILRNISVDINDGDVVCVLGQNGQGKSTLLKAIMGLHNYIPSSGQIIYRTNTLNNLSITERAQMGIFLANQNPIEIDGVLILDFYKTILQTSHRKVSFVNLYKEIEAVLQTVKLPTDFLHRYVNVGFSGGEKKKNEIAQMLLIQPELILLDEIDSGLDVDTARLILSIIKQQIVNKKTVIYVSHNKETIDTLKPNKVILIHNQQIVATGGYELAQKITTNGYKKTLMELGIKERKETLDVCIGNHFEK